MPSLRRPSEEIISATQPPGVLRDPSALDQRRSLTYRGYSFVHAYESAWHQRQFDVSRLTDARRRAHSVTSQKHDVERSQNGDTHQHVDPYKKSIAAKLAAGSPRTILQR